MTESALLLQKAERSLNAAEDLLESGHADFAVSRAYYGCFYVAQALLLSRDLLFARHGQVIGQYGLHFAKTGLLDPRFHTLLTRASASAAAPTTRPMRWWRRRRSTGSSEEAASS